MKFLIWLKCLFFCFFAVSANSIFWLFNSKRHLWKRCAAIWVPQSVKYNYLAASSRFHCCSSCLSRQHGKLLSVCLLYRVYLQWSTNLWALRSLFRNIQMSRWMDIEIWRSVLISVNLTLLLRIVHYSNLMEGDKPSLAFAATAREQVSALTYLSNSKY